MKPTTIPRTFAALSVVASVAFVSPSAFAEDLADNLAKSTAGTENAAGSRWLAASFATDATTTYKLTAVTLLLANPIAGSASVDLYSDGSLEPDSLLDTLTSPATYSSTPAATPFSAGSVPLAANTTYWIVLRALDGSFEWSWTTDDTGTGTGFDSTWDVSDDAGGGWHTHAVYPLQLRVTASTSDPIVDCNQNGAPDSLDLANGSSLDCNSDLVPDECNITTGDSADLNANGRPDECETAFLRGDANCDGKSDISDPIAALAYLFTGGTRLCCGDAADGNDDGKVDLSDAVYVLSYLFQGALAPPAPGPSLPCGIDLTSDTNDESLRCEYPEEICTDVPAGN